MEFGERGFQGTVESHSMDTCLIQTPSYNRQLCLSRRNAHIFSLKLDCLIQTPVNVDNRHFSVSQVTNSHMLSTLLSRHWLSAHRLFHCHNHVLIVDIAPCSNNDRFRWVYKISFLQKIVSQLRDMITLPFFRCFTLVYCSPYSLYFSSSRHFAAIHCLQSSSSLTSFACRYHHQPLLGG